MLLDTVYSLWDETPVRQRSFLLFDYAHCTVLFEKISPGISFSLLFIDGFVIVCTHIIEEWVVEAEDVNPTGRLWCRCLYQ